MSPSLPFSTIALQSRVGVRNATNPERGGIRSGGCLGGWNETNPEGGGRGRAGVRPPAPLSPRSPGPSPPAPSPGGERGEKTGQGTPFPPSQKSPSARGATPCLVPVYVLCRTRYAVRKQW